MASFADRTVLMRDGAESARVGAPPATGGDSLRVGPAEVDPSAEAIVWRDGRAWTAS